MADLLNTLEQAVAGFSQAVRLREVAAMEAQGARLQTVLSQATQPLAQAARAGLDDATRQRLARLQDQVASHHEALHRSVVALDRLMEPLTAPRAPAAAAAYGSSPFGAARVAAYTA